MDYYQYNITEWETIIITEINELVSKFGISFDNSYVNEPLTGDKLHFSSVELYELYCILCNKIQRTICIDNYYDFWSIREIAKTIYRNLH